MASSSGTTRSVLAAWLACAAMLSSCAAVAAQDRGGRVEDERGAVSEPEGRTWALLIGLDHYEKWPTLRYCARDVEALGRALIDVCGYDRERVRIVTDSDGATLSRADLFDSCDFLVGDEIRPEDTVLFAFAGHGATVDGRNYLVAGETRRNRLELTGLPLDYVYDQLDACVARRKLMIIDACHSGGERGVEAQGPSAPFVDGLPSGAGFVELLSCDRDQLSREDEDLGHGVFTFFLIDALQGAADIAESGNGDNRITVDELYGYVHARVAAHVRDKFGSEQTPWKRQEGVKGVFVLARVGAKAGKELTLEEIEAWFASASGGRRRPLEVQAEVRRVLNSRPDRVNPAAVALVSSLVKNRIADAAFVEVARALAGELEGFQDPSRKSEGTDDPRREFLVRAIEAARAAGDPVLEALRTLDLADIELTAGRLDEARELVFGCLDRVPSGLTRVEFGLLRIAALAGRDVRDERLDRATARLRALAESLFGRGSEEHIEALRLTADRLEDEFRFEDSADVRREALERMEKSLQSDADPTWLRRLEVEKVRLELAETLKVLGDLPAALDLEERAYAVHLALLPRRSPDLQLARLGLARSKILLGDLVGARTLQRTALEALLHDLPSDDARIQVARVDLAETLRRFGDLAGAEALLNQVVEVRAARWPDGHPDLARARLALAATRLDMGDLAGAGELYRSIVESLAETSSEDDPDLQLARANLALVVQGLGDLHGALALHEQVLAVRSRTLPDDHPDLQRARLDVAATRFALGDLRGALAMQEKALAVLSGILPDDHPVLLDARRRLASMVREAGDPGRAVRILRPVVDVYRDVLPADHLDLADARTELAQALGDIGELQEAVSLRREVVDALSTALGDEHPRVVAAREALAQAQQRLRDH